MLSPESKEYTIKALKNQIKNTEKMVEARKSMVLRCERELARKQGTQHGSGAFALNIEFDESSSAKLLRESKEKLKSLEPRLAKFKKALEEVESL